MSHHATGLPVLAEADIVVVGAGSAGAMLAATLAERTDLSILVVEAGPPARDPLLSVPLLTGYFLRSPRYIWPFATTPQAHLDGRSLHFPRGRVVGGSGAINGMVWARGLPSDYDHWAQRGLRDWSWQQVEPAFQSVEDLSDPRGGRALGIEMPGWWTDLYDAFLDGAAAAGLGRTDDFNGPAPEGAGRYRFTIRHGRRAPTGTLLMRAVKAGRVRLVTGATVMRLDIADGEATGITIRRDGVEQRIFARREVVLSAGTVGSPHILMASGVGPAAELAAAGVTPVVDAPCVGRNLHDHLLVRVEHRALQPGGLNRLLRADRAALALAEALVFGRGPAACFPLLTGGFFRSDPTLPEPDLQSHFMPALTSATIRVNPFRAPPGVREGDGFFANIFQMRPESRGTIRLAGPEPDTPPLIDPAYLSAEADRRVLREGVRLLRRIFAGAAFDPWRGEEMQPGAAVRSDDEIDAFIRAAADTVFHPVGTCRMGTDDAAVVDGRLKARGVGRLRIVDASVMPAITSSNTNAPTVMIARRAADFIAAE
ncbi:GMC family oxidoreductase [Acuticoccus mangrovi]|uniref:GMC family oxidoreductase N-terminal domain-containing protein n=1 Tax=Acuticoccus mangrovi TaxID=2796142 RepID=A0A934MDF8_9HYPH|nr:GMC oxidoreductase [Acuticoccus mangrovi]MBJ3776307.1 GMC family oxidoreductase N-terminal domain-containing protein [Acuticoccus mangrovi]